MIDFKIYEHKFVAKARRNGYSEDSIQKCLEYADFLNSNSLPIIYDSFHLAGLVGYNHTYLSRAINSTPFFYKEFKIKKKNNLEYRIIYEPLPSLKEIQYFILYDILYKVKVSKYCKSYIPKKKFKEFLKYHTNQKIVYTLDIRNFFPSIKYEIIFKLFRNMGYSRSVSDYLSGLTTFQDNVSDSKFDRYLPQGAPTSPYLSNIIMMDFDDFISRYCNDKEIKYTRYADDIVFSGEEMDIDEINTIVIKQLNRIGLSLNVSKSRVMKQNVPQLVSGVVLNRKMQLPKKQRNELKNIMFFIKKFGLEDHLYKISENRENYLNHLLGRINYGLSLNPKDSELLKYHTYLKKLLKEKSPKK